MNKARPRLADVWRLWRILRASRADVLQTWLYHSDLAGLVIGRLAGIRRIVWNIRCSELDARYERGRDGLVLRLLVLLSRYPAVVIANSFAGREVHARHGYRPRRWEILPNGFDTERFAPDPDAHGRLCTELGLAPEHKLIGLVARDDPLKDHPTFLRAAAICARARPDTHFVLVGPGIDADNAALSTLIEAGGLHGRVHLLGERTDVPELTAALDIATCSSSGEGFPNVVGEAMACGVPVVATDVGDCARLLGDAGLIVPPGDPDAFAAALDRLLAMDAVERREMGARGRHCIARDYSIDRIAARYAEFYGELQARARPR